MDTKNYYPYLDLSDNLIYNINVEGFATLAILISFLSGLIIFILGLIGEYLIRIYKLVEKSDKIIIESYIE